MTDSLHSFLDISNETGYHPETIRIAALKLEISPTKADSGNKFLFTNQQAKDIFNHLKSCRPSSALKNTRRLCAICEQQGHSEKKCPHNPAPLICVSCKVSKTRNSFRIVRKSLPGNIVSEMLFSRCIECARNDAKDRYTGNLKSRLGRLCTSAKRRAKKSGWVFSVNPNLLMEIYEAQDGKCYYSKIELALERGKYSVSLDRIDSSGGYTEGNVALCCWIINHMKKNLDVAEFVDLCNKVSENRKCL